MRLLTRSWWIFTPLLLCAPLPACDSFGHFTIFGYTTQPNYRSDIKTVYVPIFQNKTFRRGVEFDLTRAVIREIESKTPYKVASERTAADTELCGTVLGIGKNLLNRNQLNEVREAETLLTVGIVWRDLRTGEVLSLPKKGGGPAPAPFAPLPDIAPGMGGVPTLEPVIPVDQPAVAPLDPAAPVPAAMVLVTSTATFIPEIGQSITTAHQANYNRLAIQIVSLMEKPW